MSSIKQPTLKTNIRKLREQNNFSINQICNMIGTNPSTYRQLESGQPKDIHYYLALCEIYGVNLDYLLNRQPTPCFDKSIVDYQTQKILNTAQTICKFTTQDPNQSDLEKLTDEWIKLISYLNQKDYNTATEDYKILFSHSYPQSIIRVDSYPYNLLNAIFYNELKNLDIKYTPQLIVELTKLIDECLSDRSSKIIKLRFINQLTYQNIGEHTNITSTRVKQIIDKSLIKLRKYFYTTRYFYSLEIREKEIKIQHLNNLINAKEHDLARIINNTPNIEIYSTLINDLELTPRVYNSLRRAGYNDVYDILKAIENDTIFKVRNLGTKGRTDILKALNKIGIIQFQTEKNVVIQLEKIKESLINNDFMRTKEDANAKRKY